MKPQKSDVLIIGGGIMGTSTAWHLAQLKAGRVVAAGVNAAVMRAFAQRENLAYRTLWSSDST